MIEIPYKKQKTPYTCGPASLRMVLLFYGITLSEEVLTERLRTNTDDGTRQRDMIRVMREEGFYVFENEESSLVEIGGLIKTGIPVIVYFVEPAENENHYAVVVKVDDTHLVLNDPWNGERVMMEIGDFLERWSSERASHENWVMAVSKDPFSLGRQYGPKRVRGGK